MSATPPVPRESAPRLDALTGVRIVAAMWVVVFHFRGNLATEFAAYRYIAPVIEYGELGVDLFFTLSGFVIAMVYGRRLSHRWSWDQNLRFWWARIIRIWPAYMVMLLIVTVWHLRFVLFGGHDPVAPREISVGSFVRQMLLIIQWTEPNSDRLTWNGPAWTVSAEMLAYLLFPLLALIAVRWVDRMPAFLVFLLSVGATTPLILAAVAKGSLYADWVWLLRIGCCFVAGFFAYYFYERVRDGRVARRVSGVVVIVTVLTALAIMFLAYRSDHHVWGSLSIALFPVLVVFLGLDNAGIGRLLSTRPFVLGGMMSYSVYLVHMPIIEPIWSLQGTFSWLAPGTTGSRIAFLVVPFLVLLGGYALWRWVEEPARARWKDVWWRRATS